MLELLRQILETLQAHHFAEKPFLERFLGDFQTLPGSGDVLQILQKGLGFVNMYVR